MNEQKTPTISVCISVCTEDKRIGGCIDSILDFADEIIISDIGSTDKTVQIVEEYTKNNPKIKLYHYTAPNEFHFGIAKNFCMAKATKDYIFVLDADERLSQAFKDNLRPFLKKHSPHSVSIVRCDELLTNLEEHIERIVKRSSGIFHGTDADSKVHEHFIHSYEVLTFPYPLWHCQREKHWLVRPHSRFFYLGLEIDRTPKTKSLLGHIIRGIWMFQYKFKRVYIKQGMYKEGMVGFRYAMLRALYSFLIQLFVGLKQENYVFWETESYKKRIDNKVILKSE